MSSYIGTQNAANAMQTGIFDEEKSGLWQPTYGWGYQDRGPQALAWQWATIQMWPQSGFLSGNPSVPLCLFGQDAAQMDYYEPWNLGISGHNTPYFLQGTCKDSLGNILGGAIVQAFITSTDAFDGQTTCDDRGVFQVPCFSTEAHYLVAYYPGAPDKAGSTVNTLIPARLT